MEALGPSLAGGGGGPATTRPANEISFFCSTGLKKKESGEKKRCRVQGLQPAAPHGHHCPLTAAACALVVFVVHV